MANYSTPRDKFEQQRRQAKQRRIEWLLTFDEWFAIWQESGRWNVRGKRAGQYVMARRGDAGPYSRENVYICLASENHSHAHLNGRGGVAEVRGWYRVNSKKKPYAVERRGRYIGTFATPEEASAAFWSAA